MTDDNRLSPELEALIARARQGREPTAENLARVRWRLEPLLASGAQPRRPRRLAVSAALGLAVGGASLAAAAAGAGLFGLMASPSTLPVVTAAAPSDLGSAAAPPRPAPPMASVSAPAAAVSTSPSASPRSRAGGPRPLTLAEETALLARANAATNRGDPEAALAALGAYDRQVAGGVLAEERAAARVVALCAAGRIEEARREAARFETRWPHSPQRARLRSSCVAR